MKSEWLALISAIIGGCIATLGNLFIEMIRERTLSKRMASAFSGEIGSLVHIIKKRGYIIDLEEIISNMEKGTKQEMFFIHVRKNYFRVYEANACNVGILKNPLPAKIVTFYAQLNSLLEDIQSVKDGEWDKESDSFVLEAHKEMLSLIVETVRLGEIICGEIEEIYG